MVNIVTRAGKGSPLTHDEVDANFNNLNSGVTDAAATATAAAQQAASAAQQAARYNPANVAITGGKLDNVTVSGPFATAPDQIPGLQLWLDASQPLFTANYAAQCLNAGDQVAIWPDLSGNGRIPTASATKPTYDPVGMNGRPTINFNGNSNFITPSFLDASYNGGFTLFAVSKAIAGAANKAVLASAGNLLTITKNDAAKGATAGLSNLSVQPNVTPYVNVAGVDGLLYRGGSFTYEYDRLFMVTNSSAGNSSGSNATIPVTGTLGLNGAITIGDGAAGGFAWPGQISEVLLWNRPLSNEQFRAIYDYLSAKWGLSTKKFVLCAGNSLTSGQNSTGGATQIISPTGTNYPGQMWNLLGAANYDVRTDAYPGRTTAQLLAETPAFGDLLWLPSASPNNICVVWETSATLAATQSRQTAYQQTVNYCKARRARGYKVIIVTVMARQDGAYAGFEADRLAINTLIRANFSQFADGLADIALDARLSDPNNLTYFGSDKLHLTDAGYTVVAGIVAPVVQSLSGGAIPFGSKAADIDNGRINNTPIGKDAPHEVHATVVDSTGPITAAGAVRGAITDTPNTTVGNSTLTAASMVGGIITRSGSTAIYTDTTDTAANIINAIQLARVGTSFDLTIINSVAFANTIAAGTGVTLAGTTAIAASTWRRFVGTITNTATPAVTLKGVASGPL